MENTRENSIRIIVVLLKQFLEGKYISLLETQRKNPLIFHYYYEIIRFWSKLNFIIKYTLVASKTFKAQDKTDMAKLLFLTYRFRWENASIKSIIDELKISNKSKLLDFNKYANKLQSFSLKRALKDKSKIEKLSILESIPTFTINRLLPVMSFEFLKEIFRHSNYINNKKITTLRINTLTQPHKDKDLIESVIKEMRKNHIKLHQDSHFPELIHVPLKARNLLLKNNRYKSGNIIFQDKASSAIIHTFSPKPHELICDMCAAPGIKTSLIAQYTKNQATIIAGEFLLKRAIEMKKLLKLLNVFNCHKIITDSSRFPTRLYNKFDRVLLDAPCTGSGTFLTNPELKWRQNENFLNQNTTLQKYLLRNAIKLLKPGGILVYSTCSLYPEEGELQVIHFLKSLEPIEIPVFFSPSYKIDNSIIPGTGRLFPSIHQTQGFFVGKFKKKKKFD